MIRALPLLLPRLHLAPLAAILRWQAVARQRRALARLDDAALRDVGLSREEARQEAARPFWDAPENWRI
ncbi:DUF1127 domain-containing protein [Tropicibacter oceani]|uniref:DUF1127 domain-containing protein n=1 Tax=Tropicibacter oceani TaxID=3058420 RepID=A0ABY8QEJ0_9RHOB|nr:DUF1127 domain-containing protein [Tropicibacter oceani]WGW02202.1 DUF1127 domain-containing protein [Tropicibacter oceani]